LDVWDSILGRDSGPFLLPRPDRFWGMHSLLSNGHRRFFRFFPRG